VERSELGRDQQALPIVSEKVMLYSCGDGRLARPSRANLGRNM
jgi:hypothetical protein